MKIILKLLFMICSAVLISSKSFRKNKSKRYDPFYFTHEVLSNYVKGTFDRGLLLSTSYLIGGSDVQQAYTGSCGIPILFTRIVSHIASGSLDVGSNGARSAVMFVINKEAATDDDKTPAVGTDTFSTYERSTDTAVLDKIQKVCYSSNSDVGGGRASMPSNRFNGFADLNSIYNAAKRNSLIFDNNEQGFGAGIALNPTNIKYVIFKVRPVYKSGNNHPCLVLRDETSSARVDTSVNHQNGFAYYLNSVNNYFKGSTTAWGRTSTTFGSTECYLVCKDSTCNSSIYVDKYIKELWVIAGSLQRTFRVMSVNDKRRNIMNLDNSKKK